MGNQIVKYVSNQMQIELTPELVKSCLVRGGGNVTNEEITLFMNLCAYRQLNPFLNECYLIKYGTSPVQIVTSQDVFLNRANANPHFRGYVDGVIVQKGDALEYRRGSIVLKSETLIGGWCEGFRDDRDHPVRVEVMLEEYDKHQALWKEKPASQITKVARSQCLRRLFSDELAGLYGEAEGATLGGIIDITPIREPIGEPQRKSQTKNQSTDSAPPPEGTDVEMITPCPKCGGPLGKDDKETAQVIEWCNTKRNGDIACRKCQK